MCARFSQAQLNTSLIVDELCLRWYMVASAMPAMHSFYGTESNTRMPYDLAGAYRWDTTYYSQNSVFGKDPSVLEIDSTLSTLFKKGTTYESYVRFWKEL